jgi:hypothetical protein
MTGWKMTMIEPTLDDLLDDDIMTKVMRSSGIDAAQLRARLSETARRRRADETQADGTMPVPPPAVRASCIPTVCCSA